jgi:hypothetical protein
VEQEDSQENEAEEFLHATNDDSYTPLLKVRTKTLPMSRWIVIPKIQSPTKTVDSVENVAHNETKDSVEVKPETEVQFS